MKKITKNLKKEKVLLVQKYLAPYRVSLFNAIQNYQNIEFILFNYGKPERRRKWKKLPKVNFRQIQAAALSIPLSYEKNLNLPLLFNLKSQKLNPDVFIAAPDIAGFFFLFYTKIFKKKFMVWIEYTLFSEEKSSYLKEKLRGWFFSQMDAIIVPGLQSKTYLAKFQFKKTLFYAPNTVDSNNFQISVKQIEKKFNEIRPIRFLFSGSLIKRKGFDLLIKAVKQVNEKGMADRFRVDILGSGELEVESVSNVAYHGFVEGREYSNFFKSAHVFILPSVYDCNPLTILEAAKTGNIILCSEGVGNHNEFVDNNGIVFERNSVSAIVTSIEKVLNIPQNEQIKMGKKSLELSREITHENSARAFYEAIQYVTGNTC